MSVHTCPFCALRYEFLTELEYHIAQEHDRDWGPAGRNPAKGHHPSVPSSTNYGSDR